MFETIGQLGQSLGGVLTLAAEPGNGGAVQPSRMIALVPFLPLIGSVLCGIFAIMKVRSKLPAWTTVALLACSFAIVLMTYMGQRTAHVDGADAVVKAFDWIVFNGAGTGVEGAAGVSLVGNFSFYVDSLTLLWMLFVTGLATCIALYGSEYMSGDVGGGYCRFYGAFCLFVFSMACLVMGDNLLLLYLGWEGVGLCSYLLIGYFYKKPSAVAAAKKAFIMNRIGDLGLALGVMLTFVHFGTVEYASLFDRVSETVAHGDVPFLVKLIPILLTVGAFGKSAQLFLYVWLPDAMEGPTPVSALIHAATMVTAGVYLVARLLPVYELSPDAIWLVGWGGAITAFWAATIGMAQFDIKRIMAYSTVSQLGYMFAGLAVAGHNGVGGPSHVFTHAFFKALLFLACGAVMHGFAGQLDLRKLSGVQKMPGWKIVGITMLVGCLNLAGFPVITAGYWSKDIILADAFANERFVLIGWLLLLTAGMTAYYTFRVYFRVFLGPVEYHPGDELHGHGDDHGHGHDHGHDDHAHSHGHGHDDHGHGHDHHGHFHPHAPGWAINLVLAVLAIATFAAIPLVHSFTGSGHGWVGDMVHNSTAGQEIPLHGDHSHAHAGHAHDDHAHHGGDHAGHAGGHAHATFFGFDPHKVMYYVSGVVGFIGIGVAYFLHLAGRKTAAKANADKLLPLFGPLARGAQHKWYVDEIYGFLIVTPLKVISHIFHLIDKALVDGLVNLAGILPRGAGMAVRRTQTGMLHDYALRMVGGVAAFVVLVLILTGVFGGMEHGSSREAGASTGAPPTPVPQVQTSMGDAMGTEVHP